MKPTVTVDEMTGIVTVENLPISRTQKITAVFRGLCGADDVWLGSVINPNNEGISNDWKMLSKLCIKWGEDSSVTSGEFVTSEMPFKTLAFLRSDVLPIFFQGYSDDTE